MILASKVLPKTNTTLASTLSATKHLYLRRHTIGREEYNVNWSMKEQVTVLD